MVNPSPLQARLNVTEIITAMLERPRVDLNPVDVAGRTPLYEAVKAGRLEAVKLLLAKGANPNIIGIEGQHPLLAAVEAGKPNLEIIRLLLHAGTCNHRIERDDDSMVPVLHLALAKHGAKRAAKMVDLLVQYGIDVNLRNSKGKSSLEVAITKFRKCPAIAARIILNDGPGASPLAEDVYNEVYTKKKSTSTPLLWMVGYKQNFAVRRLLELGVGGQNERHEVPTEFIPKKGPGSEYRQPCSPFELAVFTGSADCAAIFIEEDPVVYLSMLQAPAGYQYGEGFEDGWDYLAEPDAPPSATKYARNDHMCVIALMRSTAKAAHKWVALFLKLGLDFSAPQSSGISLVAVLIALGHTTAAMAVLTNPDITINLDATDDKGRSLLFYACFSKRDDRTDILRYLLEHGADPTKMASDGTTPAIAACRNNDLKTFLMIRNVDFLPYQATRLIKADDPGPVGSVQVIAGNVGLDGVDVYTEPTFDSELLATIPGQAKSFAVNHKTDKRRNSLVSAVLDDQTFTIGGTMSINVREADEPGAIRLTIENCKDLAGAVEVDEDNKRSDPHVEVVLESDIKRSKVHLTPKIEDEFDPEFNALFKLSSTQVPGDAKVGGQVAFKLSFDAELEQLTVEVEGITALNCQKFAAASVHVSLMEGCGGHGRVSIDHSVTPPEEHSFKSEPVKLMKENFSGTRSAPTALTLAQTCAFNVDTQQYNTKLLKIDLVSKDKLLGTCSGALCDMIVETGAHEDATAQTLPLVHMLWQFDHCVLEVWHGKRGDKKSKFLGQCRVDLAAACRHGGSLELTLQPIDSDDTWGAGVGIKVRNFEPIPVVEKQGEWVHVHQTYYYDMLETFELDGNSVRPYDPYTQGWICVKNKAGRPVLKLEEGSEKQKLKMTGPCQPKKWPSTGILKRKLTVASPRYQKRCPARNYVQNPKYGQFAGEEMNRTDRLGNTALYYGKNLDVHSERAPPRITRSRWPRRRFLDLKTHLTRCRRCRHHSSSTPFGSLPHASLLLPSLARSRAPREL